MGKFDKVMLKLLSGASDNNFSFDDLIYILLHFDFVERSKGGSHKIFYKEGIEEIINIQPKGNKAKPYQVKQIRMLIFKYKLNSDGK
ncbi:MAG: type II toxin-antitoxin system HicA family toxin [Mucilaginibacter sp.]